MLLRSRLLAALAAALVLFAVLVAPGTAEAARTVSTPTTLSPATSSAVVGQTVRLRGTTSKRQRTVVLQRKSGKKWVKVTSVRSRSGKFSFPVAARRGTTTYRAVATSRRVGGVTYRTKKSRTVTVRGSGSAAMSDPTGSARAVEAMRAAINAHRASRGRAALIVNDCMTSFSATHSRRMAERNLLAHSNQAPFRSMGSTFATACRGVPANRGEIVAVVQASTPEQAGRAAVQAWIGSKGHREIMESTSGGVDQIGLGMGRTKDGRWWSTGVVVLAR